MSTTHKTTDHDCPTVLVFVYGTLTDPDRVETLLGDGPGEYAFRGDAVLEGLHRVDGRYPTLVPGECVEGRVLEVDDRTLERLDRYEGVDYGLYTRVSVPDTEQRPVQVYVGDPVRLGVEADVGWPDAPSFRQSVRAALERADVVLRYPE
ncbi:gamma-glutamylcyclotransferase family protein [Natronorubrum sulfidifaciens]|uniref:AIG2 family protein n=1 Tax=Natronorubrum sulfidifaciens JCM 14089 TaxID=1230460 RepID=L9WGM2_9EURY|nr:gamma-glutamylcyclotransferase family protein [Natronorubrum sulfidifaciens]ELY47478.1 AIG2 family protein [Natronorubrum sulfidifaciens JCM 14089]